jgi:C-methyltransferase C-terminal domain
VIANNVFAHVPDLNDFTAGLGEILAPGGLVTLEFPHVARLIEGVQFDTIYHEHFSYFSFATARRVLARHGLAVLDVEEIPTHGGSLRVYATRPGDLAARGGVRPSVALLLDREAEAGLDRVEGYAGFDGRCRLVKRRLLDFLIRAADEGRSVVGYGAPGKGNTLLNYCGIRSDLLAYTVDRSPHKQGLHLPGTHIPIHHPDRIAETRPDHVLILPWNLRDEIVGQLSYVRDWGGSFVVPIPEVELIP